MSNKLDQRDSIIKELEEQRDRAFEIAMDLWLYGRCRSTGVSSKYKYAEEQLTQLENELLGDGKKR